MTFRKTVFAPTICQVGWLSYFWLIYVDVSVNCHAQTPRQFQVTLSPTVAKQAISGRLYVFSTTRQRRLPMRGPDWFRPEPFAAMEVANLQPGQSVIIDDQSDCFPVPIASWPETSYRLQAVLDHDFNYPAPAEGPGNFYSAVFQWQPADSDRVHLILDKIVPEVNYTDTQRVKFIQRPSQLLSKHFGHEVIDRVAVILPESYFSQPDRHYPVHYEVTGFGGNLKSVAKQDPHPRRGNQDQFELIKVIMTGECKNGHHVYANSSANGPRGDAFIHEMIPHIDSHFRTLADADARFIGGHSSGGWSSLWLMINYPDQFGAVFSTSPDPVDFRDFQGTDLYAQPPPSLYRDSVGKRRPLARRGQEIVLWYDDFCKMDHVLGRGGQMHSFDAAFSPLDDNGRPRRCWDVTTGVVDPEVVAHWLQYDISQQIQQRWEQLQDQLPGKIHLVMGELDTFYLQGAAHRLDQRLKLLGCEAQIQFLSDASHNLPSWVFQEQRQTMRQIFQRKFNADGSRK